ncbi:MAG: bifunctional phosphopantothenoylcysteine decarboxylase/phosphopantothenate--cysteine ligase CoaBC [Cryobacterium sp.]
MTPRTIVVGITGGIAAYKAVSVVRAFVLHGHTVHVIATPSALRFIGAPTLEAISRNPVQTDLFDGVAEVRHVAIGQSADAIVIVPATANSIAKIAAGLADDLLGTTILASTAPLVIAPAMHTEMWNNAATTANLATLRSRGVHIVGPGVGRLTGTDVGPGRLEEPDTIVAAVYAVLQEHEESGHEPDWAGRHVLISAGGTREPLDPVRFLGNRSSGRQGVSLADAALARGARVTLVAAHLEVPAPAGVDLISVSSAAEMLQALQSHSPAADVVIMAAAVADYRPSTVQGTKIKKDDAGDTLTLSLVKNPDILAGLTAARPAGQIIVGFAAETETDAEEFLALGRAKIIRKGCDLLVLNRVGWTEGFVTEGNTITVLDRSGAIVTEASGTKMSVAAAILEVIDSL